MDQRSSELDRGDYATGARTWVDDRDSMAGQVPDKTDDMDTTLEVEETRLRIEQTRTEMGETIDAITERLSPQNLKDTVQEAVQERVEQAKDTVRQATIGKVEGAVGAVADKMQGAANSAGEVVSNPMQAASTTSRSLMDMVKRHPLPASVMALGATWLYLSSRNDNGNQQRQGSYPQGYGTGYQRYGTGYQGQMASSNAGSQDNGGGGMSRALSAIPDTAGQMATKAGDSASQIGSQMQDTARQAQGTFQRLLQENPLAVSVAVAGLGMVAGLAVPETDTEDQLLGGTRDAMMATAAQKAQDTAQKVQSVAQEALNAAKQEAQEQDLLPDDSQS